MKIRVTQGAGSKEGAASVRVRGHGAAKPTGAGPGVVASSRLPGSLGAGRDFDDRVPHMQPGTA